MIIEGYFFLFLCTPICCHSSSKQSRPDGSENMPFKQSYQIIIPNYHQLELSMYIFMMLGTHSLFSPFILREQQS